MAVNWKKSFCIVLVLPLFILACRSGSSTATTTEPTITPSPSTPTTTPTATPEPTVTPRPSPTPVRARIDVQDQTLTETAVLHIDEVVSTDPGWLVVFNTVDGTAKEVIGQTAVSFGVIADLDIEIDLAQVSETLIVQLYNADSEASEFDLASNTAVSPPVAQQIEVELEITLPEIVVSEQEIDPEVGTLLLDSVLTDLPSWVVIQTFDDDEIGELVGIVHVNSGVTRNVEVPLRWREASNSLVATLVADNGNLHEYEPDIDTPITVAQEEVQVPFTITLPIDVLVYDQPLADGFITIDRIISPADGWVAVYYDDDDALGLIIGYSPIEAGVNYNVAVDVIDSAITDPLYIVLHRDSNPDDEFDLPLNDQPFLQNGQVVPPFSFSISPELYFVAKNQPLQEVDGESGIEITSVFVEFSSWVVVQALDEAGEAGDFLGQTAVSPGINHNVFVPVPEAYAGQTVMVTLYLNSGDAELFEPDEGIDIPLRLNQQDVQAPLSILPSDE